MLDQALSHIKVLDFTQHVAGPYCTKLMADQGADVIKVERPGTGDVARRLGPYPGDVPHPEKSGLFLHLNTNKRSVTLDLSTDAGRKHRPQTGGRGRCGGGKFSPREYGVFRTGLSVPESR